MKICIVGLGLIGGSYAMGLTKANHEVYGIDNNLDTIKYAIDKGFIKDGSTDNYSILSEMDLIILAIYPQSILKFLEENNKFFKTGQVITDVCGIKTSFVNRATELSADAIYCSHHPMAGKEKIGIEYADSNIFNGANYLITPLENTPNYAIDCLKIIGQALGFGRISVITPERHDKMIGFTSQLTHAIAVSLVNSDRDDETKSFIGDSYRDLTRIAMINEKLWSELFLENKNELLNHIENFEKELDVLKNALRTDDKKTLNELFKHSTIVRKKMEK